jgi:hypothetical protein
MRLLPLALLVFALGCTAKDRPVAPAEPKSSDPTELPRAIRALPRQGHFSISGLAFLEGTLFAATNVGLLEFGAGNLKGFHRWYDDFNTISGPWKDAANRAIWIFRDDDGRFVRLDAERIWTRFDLPAPPRGYYSRGDVLEGFSIAPTESEPRLLGSGSIWQLEKPGTWKPQPTPQTPELSSIRGYVRLPDSELLLVRAGMCLRASCKLEAHRLANGTWQQRIPLPIGSVAQTAQVGKVTYARSTKGELVEITANVASLTAIPGFCEAITVTSSGRLLASFRDRGVFEFDGVTWAKRFDSPYTHFEGEHWVYLAEEAGSIALATASVPNLKPGSTSEWFYTGTDALWFTQGEQFRPIELRR